MLILANIYIVDTHIYSLHLVANIIVFKILPELTNLLKAFALTKFNYRLKSNRRLPKHRCTNRVVHTHVNKKAINKILTYDILF